MVKDSVVKAAIREVVREEIKPFEDKVGSFENRLINVELYQKNLLGSVKSLLEEFKNDLTQMKDEIVGEIQKFREENTILELKGQHKRLIDVEEKVEELHRRLQIAE